MKKCQICEATLVKKDILIFSDIVKLDEMKYEVQFKITGEYCQTHPPSQGGEISTDFRSLHSFARSIDEFNKQFKNCRTEEAAERVLSQFSTNNKKFKMRKVS